MTNTTHNSEMPLTYADGTTGSEASAIIDAIERHGGFATVDIETDAGGMARVAVVPAGKELVSLKPFIDEYRREPDRRRGVAKLESLPALIAHVNRFKAAHTAVFVAGITKGAPVVRAVYDYHPAGPEVTDARRGAHRAEYALELSPEWKAWELFSGKALTASDFAAFLEERITDVYAGEPSPAMQALVENLGLMLASPTKLVELSRKLEVSASVKVKQSQVLATGEIAITYEESHADGAGQPIRVPNAFQIAIPVFAGSAPFQMLVRLAYRRVDGGIHWIVRLHDAARVRAAAAEEVCETIRTETGCPVFHGLPEA